MKVSVIIPTYEMEGKGLQFLKRSLEALEVQSFEDFEVVVTDDSRDDVIQDYCLKVSGLRYFKNPDKLGMASNTNRGMDLARGDLIKILYQDDYLSHRHALREMVKHLTPTFGWLVAGCIHSSDGVHLFGEHHPFYSESQNTIGSPSVVMVRKEVAERFNPKMTWILDLDFYRRLLRKYGRPKILNEVCVVIGIGPHQTTYKLTDEYKEYEHNLLNL